MSADCRSLLFPVRNYHELRQSHPCQQLARWHKFRHRQQFRQRIGAGHFLPLQDRGHQQHGDWQRCRRHLYHCRDFAVAIGVTSLVGRRRIQFLIDQRARRELQGLRQHQSLIDSEQLDPAGRHDGRSRGAIPIYRPSGFKQRAAVLSSPRAIVGVQRTEYPASPNSRATP